MKIKPLAMPCQTRPVRVSSLRVVLIIAFWGLIFSGCAHTGGGSVEGGQPPSGVLIEVLYATDRNVTGDDKPTRFYGGNRGDMTYGRCQVVVRPSKARSPYADQTFWKPDAGKNSRRRAALRSMDMMDKQEFLKAVTHRSTNNKNKSVLVYLHGYGRKFERAMSTTATLVYEMSYLGVPILYSWPSKGSAEAYPADRTAIDWSTPHLQTFLETLAADTGVDTIHLMAHSLGNRALLKVLANLTDTKLSNPGWNFGEIILVAPDVDRAIFKRDYAPLLVKMDSRVTLYVSSIDVPLSVSRKINRYPRVGDSKDGPIIRAGIETVDASDVTNLIIGHSYYRDSPEALSDLYYLINHRLSADQRPTLVPADASGARYWKIKSNKLSGKTKAIE